MNVCCVYLCLILFVFQDFLTESASGQLVKDDNPVCNCLEGLPCNETTWTCPNGCAAGFKGNSCNTGCSSGEYGEDCGETCGHCNEGPFCDKVTGQCKDRSPKCMQGWKGTACKTECGNSKYGADCHKPCGHCRVKTESCNRYRGTCPPHTSGLHCQEGFIGSDCQTECIGGTYGLGCNETCGLCWRGNSSCHPVDGRCNRCKPGWTGNTCKTKCYNGTYGEGCGETCGRCTADASCDTTTGHCPNKTPRCEAGWTGETCKHGCVFGTYGASCQKACGQCSVKTESCNRYNGTCPPHTSGLHCQEGYTGNYCKTECTRGTYGLDCNETCGFCWRGNLSCHHVDGRCSRCGPGWSGNTCKSDKPEPDEPITVLGLYIGGPIAGVILLLVAIVVLMYVFIRQRRIIKIVDGSKCESVRTNSILTMYTNSSGAGAEERANESHIEWSMTTYL